MTLPTLSKTWQFNVNNAQGALSSITLSNKQMVFLIKQALIGAFGSWTNAAGGSIATPTSSLWTVAYSCDSNTAGTVGDGVDHWTSASSILVANSTAFSWIVLKNTHIDPGGNFQICIACPNSDGVPALSLVGIILSRNAGFTGGSTTSRPTATDEVVLNPKSGVNSVSMVPAGQFDSGGASYGFTLHYLMSTDALIHRIFITNGSLCQFFFGVGQSTDVDWSPGIVAYYAAGGNFIFNSSVFGPFDGPLTAGYGTWSKQNARPQVGSSLTTVYGCSGLINSGSFIMAMSARGVANTTANGNNWANHYITTLGTQPNSISNDYLIEPVGLTANSSTTFPGRHGVATDLWWSNAPAGSTFPSSGTPQFAQLGSLMVPWNGSTPVV